MGKVTRLRNDFGGPGPVTLEGFAGKPLPGGKMADGRVGGLPSARKKAKGKSSK